MRSDAKALAVIASIIVFGLALPWVMYLVQDSLFTGPVFSESILLGEEISLPAAEEIKSVVASLDYDDVVSFEKIPPFELPRETAIRIVDHLRPMVIHPLDDITRKQNAKFAPLRLTIVTHQSGSIQIEVLLNIGLQRALMLVEGRECARGGGLFGIGPLMQLEVNKPPVRVGDFDEGLCLRGVVRDAFESTRDQKDRSADIEESFLFLDASSGRRPVEELDARRERASRNSEKKDAP